MKNTYVAPELEVMPTGDVSLLIASSGDIDVNIGDGFF